MRRDFGSFYVGLRFTLEWLHKSRHPYHPQGVRGDGQGRPWPSQSRSAMSPGEVPTSSSPSTHQGGSGEDGIGSTGELVQEQNLVAKPEMILSTGEASS